MRMDEHIKRLIEKYTIEASRVSPEEAVEKYSMAYAQAKELGNAFTMRACQTNLGAAYIRLGRKEEAQKGLDLLAQAKPPDGVRDATSNGDLYFNQALGYQVLGRYREATHYLEQAWTDYHTERDNLGMEIETLKRLVQISQVRRKPELEVKWSKELEKTYELDGKHAEKLQVMVKRIYLQRLEQKGTQQQEEVQQKEEQLEDVEEDVKKVLTTLEENGKLDDGDKGTEPVKVEVRLLVQIVVLLTRLGKLDAAKEWLKKATDKLDDEEDQGTVEKAVVLQNLGTVYNYMGDWDSAIPYHRRAAAIFQRFAAVTSDPAATILPLIAKRCQGHCLANQAYAESNLDNVDDARMLFEKALELARECNDKDTEWQMKEALAAVHFRLAVADYDGPRSAEVSVGLRRWQRDHLSKALDWYKQALSDACVANAGQKAQDRVLEKYTLAKAFSDRTFEVEVGYSGTPYQSVPPSQPIAAAVSTTTSASPPLKQETSRQEDEEEDEESDEEEETGSSSDEDEEDDDDDDDDEDGVDEGLSEGEVRLGKTMRTQEFEAREDDEDDDKTQVNALYRAHLGTGTLRANEGPRKVEADIHPPPQTNYSSSAESARSHESEDDDASDDDEETDDSEEDTEDEKRQLPAVPIQSPPNTMLPSGTYETPQQPQRSPSTSVQRPDRSSPSPQPPAGTSSTNYASLDFSGRRPQHQQASGGNYSDPDYEPVDVQKSSPPQQRSASKGQGVQFQMGEEVVAPGKDKQEQKDSKTCSIM